jgi:hypothetical protein
MVQMFFSQGAVKEFEVPFVSELAKPVLEAVADERGCADMSVLFGPLRQARASTYVVGVDHDCGILYAVQH